MYSKRVLIGTYTNQESEGIYQLLDDRVELFSKGDNPTYITGDQLYIYTYFSNESGCGLQVLDKSGTEIERVYSSEKKGPCFICKHPKMDSLFTANFHEHKLIRYDRIDGHFQVAKEWTCPNQESHLHHIYFNKDVSKMYVCDLGCDKIYTFSTDYSMSLLEKFWVTKDSGPRHMISTKDHHYYYLFTELSTEIFVYENMGKSFNRIQSIMTTKVDSKKSGAAIRMSDDERFLYVSNRIENSIVVYKIDHGQLIFVERVDCGGDHPRDFNLIDDVLICTNRDSNNLVIFKRNAESGQLSKLKSIECYQPVAVYVDNC